MSFISYVLFYNILFTLLLCTSVAQQKANNKCAEFLKTSRFPVGLSIIGGSLSQHQEFPHMVALGYGPKRNLKWLCGGTIISEMYILTAAHCSTQQEYGPVKMARMGVRNLKQNQAALDIEISKIIRHPNYKPPSLYNDIALLRVKTPIQFSRSVQPACLNTAYDIRPRTNKVTATGWGLLAFGGTASDDLMKVDLNLYVHKQCQLRYTTVSKRKLSNGIDNSLQICAGGRGNEEKDTCQGDSGGPLVIKTGSLYTVLGVTAFGKACGIASVPGVYTRVSYYVPWIERNVWPK